MLSKSLLKFILEGNYPIHPPSNNSVNLVLGKTHILCLKFTLPILDVNASNIIFSELKKTLNVGFRTSYRGNYKNLQIIFLSHHPSLRQYYIISKLVAGCVCAFMRVCVCVSACASSVLYSTPFYIILVASPQDSNHPKIFIKLLWSVQLLLDYLFIC